MITNLIVFLPISKHGQARTWQVFYIDMHKICCNNFNDNFAHIIRLTWNIIIVKSSQIIFNYKTIKKVDIFDMLVMVLLMLAAKYIVKSDSSSILISTQWQKKQLAWYPCYSSGHWTDHLEYWVTCIEPLDESIIVPGVDAWEYWFLDDPSQI